jgi:formyl-CoA transferase
MALLENAVVRYTAAGDVPGRLGSRHPYGDRLNHAYLTSNGAMIAGFSAREWPKICAALGREDWLTDPVLSQPQENPSAAEEALQGHLRSNTTAHWIGQLEQAGVMCVPINSIDQALEETPIVERGVIQDTVDSKGRHLRMVASPLRLSRTPPRVGQGPPELGEHGSDVLKDWLDMGSDEFARHQATGVFSPKKPRWDESGKLQPRLAGWIG